MNVSSATRFWTKVDQRGPGECWPWTGLRSHLNYGKFKLNRRMNLAHRVALSLHLGRELLPGEWACHHCDNPPCCNPAHLYIGNHQTNTRDKADRDREHRWNGKRRGEGNPNSKITADQARSIREMRGVASRAEVAARFGISAGSVTAIQTGKRWTEV